MLMSKVAAGNGIFCPAELLLMHDVFDQACNHFNVSKSDEAEDIARHILAIYQGGVVDRARLLDIIMSGCSAFPVESP